MPNWIRPQTFAELHTPKQCAVPIWPSGKRRMGQLPLPYDQWPDLYTHFLNSNKPRPQINSRGELALFVLAPLLATVTAAELELTVGEVGPNRFTACLVCRSTPEAPQILPFRFQLDDLLARYAATALCEQRELPVFVLEWADGHLMQLACHEVGLAPEARPHFRSALRRAYGLFEPRLSSRDPLDAMDLLDDELTSFGWAYRFDPEPLRSRLHGDRLYVSDLAEIMQGLAAHPNPATRAGTFLLWGRHEPLTDEPSLLYCLTPYHEQTLVGRCPVDDAIWRGFAAMAGFRGEGFDVPLLAGGLPLLRYCNGEVRRVRLEGRFWRRMAGLWAREGLAEGENPYGPRLRQWGM